MGRSRCSFCSKLEYEVKRLIRGPDTHICDECIEICIEILQDDGLLPQTIPAPLEVDYEKLGIKPRFNKLKFTLRDSHCFYLGPFSDPFNAIYNDHIVKCIKTEGFTIERADEIFGTQPIIEDIWEAINSALVIIADVTGKNPNVMYEIGMAHTVGKPVVIITQDINDVPFDLKHYRCIIYEYTPSCIIYEYTPRGCTCLEEKISATLRFLKNSSK